MTYDHMEDRTTCQAKHSCTQEDRESDGIDPGCCGVLGYDEVVICREDEEEEDSTPEMAVDVHFIVCASYQQHSSSTSLSAYLSHCADLIDIIACS